MKSQENIISMSGEEMEVLVGVGLMKTCNQSLASELAEIIRNLCKTLSTRAVSKVLLHNVRIGNTFALVDRRHRYRFRMEMGTHEIKVLSIDKMKSKSEQVLYVLDAGVLHLIRSKAVAA